MLKVFGTVYSENTENFKAIADALEAEGFELAYKYPNNAEVIKEVDDEQTNQTA